MSGLLNNCPSNAVPVIAYIIFAEFVVLYKHDKKSANVFSVFVYYYYIFYINYCYIVFYIISNINYSYYY